MDFMVLDWIQNNLRCDFLDTVVPWITRLGDAGMFWILLALVMLVIPKTRKAGAVLAVSLIIEYVLCNLMLKPLVGRIRPYDVKGITELLVEKPGGFSFPSGHAGASFAAVGALFFSKNRLCAPATVLAALIAFSRLYLYVHYPTDVLAGIALGMLSGYVGAYLLRRLSR